jgi:sarcosine oxidase subunit beta
VLLLLPSAGAADPFDVTVEHTWIDEVVRVARSRVPALENVPVDAASCWAGLYEMSPDGHAIVGAVPGVPNLCLVNGSSGHGAMHAPALGQLVAEIVLDGAARSLDVVALRPERFGGTVAASPARVL